ncbi:MAG TPA: DUF2339 domain-containing protein [Bryobacteraceae bacterium]|nr:DUF2339 domain-containing protein [Bryobacteraceae bacterium]
MEPTPEQQRLDIISEAIARLLKKQDEMEKRLARLEPAVSPPLVTALPVETSPPPTPEPPPARPKIEQPKKPALETKVGLTVVNRIGVITLVLGVAFFFKWAVDNNWIGPAGRVILGVLAGFAALAIADFLWRKRQQIFAQGITGAGIAIFYLSMYAAFAFYHLIPQGLAFVCMFAATAMAIALALRYGAQAIAALGFFGGYITPLLLSTGEDHPWFLFSYVLLLSGGAVALTRRRGWRTLEILSFIATAILYGGWLAGKFPESHARLVATLALMAFYALYWPSSLRLLLAAQLLASIAIAIVWNSSPAAFFVLALAIAAAGLAYAHWRRYTLALSITFISFWLSYAIWTNHAPSEFLGVSLAFLLFFGYTAWSPSLTVQGLSLLVLSGAVYYSVSYWLLKDHYHSWLGFLAAAVAAAYLAFGAYLYRRRSAEEPDLRPVLLSLGASLCFLALAIPIQFTGFAITMAWSLQAAAVTWIGLRLKNLRALVAALVLFALVYGRLVSIDTWMYSSGTSYANAQPYLLLWNTRFLTFVIAALSLFLAAWWASRMSRRIALLEYFAGHAVLLWGLSMEVIGWAEKSTPAENLLSVETVAISILFAVYAAILVGVGVATRSAVNRIAGLALIALVILKLYLFDIWQLERIYRISAFVALGILLISTSFLYSRFRGLVEGWWKDDEAGS